MNPYLRNGLAILGGILIGMIVNGAFVAAGIKIIPPPIEIDVWDSDSLKALVPHLKMKHYIFPFLAHALGTLAGAYFTARIVTKAPAFYGFIIGVFFLLMGFMNAWAIEPPLWFWVVDLIGAYLPFAIIGQLMARKKRSDEAFG